MKSVSRFAILGPVALLAACSSGTVSGDAGTNTNGTLATADTPRSIRVSFSGEKFAAIGYSYSSTPQGDDPEFADGWELQFEKYLVSYDHIRLNRQGSDPTVRQSVGPRVARQDGPWIVNLHAMGPDVGAAGSPETAWPVFSFTHGDDGSALDPSTRYAFSYDMVPAVATAQQVGITDAQDSDLQTMITHRWTSYVIGTATYRGRTPSATVDPTFVNYPTVVHFKWGWSAPSSYINCHNPALGEEDVPANRGIQPSSSSSVRAQLTVHVDHFYWDTANLDTATLRWDAIAARARPTDGGIAEVTFDDLAGASYSAPTDLAGRPVMDRTGQTTGFPGSSNAVIYQINQSAGGAFTYTGVTGITDLRTFLVHDARTQGHMNAEGSCFVSPTGDVSF